MGLIESQGTLLCIGFAIAVGAFIIQFLLCITKVHLYIKLIPLYLLGMYALFILLVLTGLIWDDTNFYISAQQFIAIILAIVGVFAGVGIGMAWVLYSTLYKKRDRNCFSDKHPKSNCRLVPYGYIIFVCVKQNRRPPSMSRIKLSIDGCCLFCCFHAARNCGKVCHCVVLCGFFR